MPFDLQPILKGEMLELRRSGQRIFMTCTPSPQIRSSGNNIRTKTVTKKMFSRNSFVMPWNRVGRSSLLMPKTVKSSAHRDSTATTKKKARSKSAGRSSPGHTGAARTTGK